MISIREKELREKLEDYLKKTASMICTHTSPKYDEHYVYLEDDDFYEESNTVYASWEVSPWEVEIEETEDGIRLPGLLITWDEVRD